MPDISAISAAISALNSAKDMAKAMIGLRDAQVLQPKIIELNQQLLEAQSSVFAVNQERATLIERVSQLEKDLVRLKAWETEKQRYQLTDIGDGTFAYTLKESMSSGEPPHYICANCYELTKKSILNRSQLPSGGDLVTCASCSAKQIIRHGYKPPTYAFSAAEKERLALEPCPLCQDGRLKTTKVEPDPTLSAFGLQRVTLTCDHCGHVETRQRDPDK